MTKEITQEEIQEIERLTGGKIGIIGWMRWTIKKVVKK